MIKKLDNMMSLLYYRKVEVIRNLNHLVQTPKNLKKKQNITRGYQTGVIQKPVMKISSGASAHVCVLR